MISHKTNTSGRFNEKVVVTMVVKIDHLKLWLKRLITLDKQICTFSGGRYKEGISIARDHCREYLVG